MLSFLLVPLYTAVMPTQDYGEVTVIFAWFAFFNVVLAYGMETAFFRFYNGDENKDRVVSTSLISILITSLVFVLAAFLGKDALAVFLNIDPRYIDYVILILGLDALAVIPFAWLRAREKPRRYAVIKILNVAVNLGLNIFFLLVLPSLAEGSEIFKWLYVPDYEISYIFIANLIASGLTLLIVINLYWKQPLTFDSRIWRKMMRYAIPVMIAGIAFTINEVFDRVLLSELLPADIAKSEIGKYSACYKLALFMTLFATAFRLGIEPFFFSHSNSENPQNAYAQITNYFVILGSIILVAVVVFSDLLKELLVRDKAYWEAMPIVPIILIASFCLGIYHNLSVWYKITDRTKIGAYISMAGAGITIAINYLFIPEIGYYASAIATLAAYASMMLLSYFIGRRYYPIPYNMRKIVFYFTLSLIISVISFYVFNRNLYVGSLLLLVFLGLVYKLERNHLKQIFFSNEN